MPLPVWTLETTSPGIQTQNFGIRLILELFDTKISVLLWPMHIHKVLHSSINAIVIELNALMLIPRYIWEAVLMGIAPALQTPRAHVHAASIDLGFTLENCAPSRTVLISL